MGSKEKYCVGVPLIRVGQTGNVLYFSELVGEPNVRHCSELRDVWSVRCSFSFSDFGNRFGLVSVEPQIENLEICAGVENLKHIHSIILVCEFFDIIYSIYNLSNFMSQNKLILAAIPVFLLSLLVAPNHSKALNANITQISFTTAPQTINVNATSSQITVQTQNSSNASESISSTHHIDVMTTSPTGKFLSNSNNWNPVTSFTMSNGTANKNFYYIDSTPGTHTISVILREENFNTNQSITILPSSTSGCISGLHLIEGQCVPDEVVCDEGLHLRDGVCVPNVVVCESGTHLDNDVCVPDQVILECGTGFHLSEGTCVPDVMVVTCESGFHLSGDVCVPDGDILSCEEGTHESDGVCVSDQNNTNNNEEIINPPSGGGGGGESGSSRRNIQGIDNLGEVLGASTYYYDQSSNIYERLRSILEQLLFIINAMPK